MVLDNEQYNTIQYKTIQYNFHNTRTRTGNWKSVPGPLISQLEMPVHDGGPGNLSPPTPVEHEIINKGHSICVTGSSVMFHCVYQIIKTGLKPFKNILYHFHYNHSNFIQSLYRKK